MLSYTAYAMKSSKRDHKSQARVAPLASAQIRAARSLIRWTAEDLASASALSVATIRRAELKEAATALTAANDLAIRHALETAGVEFIDENGGGPGVRLRKRQQKKS
jgi:transcriptional regulator with XRE-family HTH domain